MTITDAIYQAAAEKFNSWVGTEYIDPGSGVSLTPQGDTAMCAAYMIKPGDDQLECDGADHPNAHEKGWCRVLSNKPVPNRQQRDVAITLACGTVHEVLRDHELRVAVPFTIPGRSLVPVGQSAGPKEVKLSGDDLRAFFETVHKYRPTEVRALRVVIDDTTDGGGLTLQFDNDQRPLPLGQARPLDRGSHSPDGDLA